MVIVERWRELNHQLRLMVPRLRLSELEEVREELSITLGLLVYEIETRPKPKLVLVRNEEKNQGEE